MADQKPLFKAPYDIKDVSALFAIVAFVLIISAIFGNSLFGLFQQNVTCKKLHKENHKFLIGAYFIIKVLNLFIKHLDK